MDMTQDFETLASNLRASLGGYAKFAVEQPKEEVTVIRVTPKDIAMRRVVLDALISIINVQSNFDLKICSKTRDFVIETAE